MKTIQKKQFFVLLSFFIFACNNIASPPEIESPKPYDKFEDFSHFPNFVFKQIKLGDESKDVLAQIVSQPGKILYQAEYFHYQYASDSTEIIIGEQTNLSNFKLYLKGKLYLKFEEDFRSLFTEKSIKREENSYFKVFTFENNNDAFVITYFKQPDYIRLTIVSTLKKH